MEFTSAGLQFNPDKLVIDCIGSWTTTLIRELPRHLPKRFYRDQSALIFDGSELESMDSAGALSLNHYIAMLKKQNIACELLNFSPEQHSLLALVESKLEAITRPIAAPFHFNLFYIIGDEFIGKYYEIKAFMTFIGELLYAFYQTFRHPRWEQFRTFIFTIEMAGYYALPIVALLSFLIGVVLAYQLGVQLQSYGASIYIINFSGVAILREFAPLITAIIIAGRTSSSFTAEIGTMKVNEEIDALRTMGLSPMERLITPKVLALIVTLPLLTVWACVFGMFGTMVVAKVFYSITYYEFLVRFPHAIELSTFAIGIAKTPVFALIISAVGCFQGFQVSYSAESIGRKTTKSVVQAIFLIIITDAFFSVMFGWQGMNT